MKCPMRFVRAAVLFAALTAFFVPAGLSAQDTLRVRYGLVGGWSFNIHRADFRALPGIPNCCPNFQSGSGGGPYFGALAEFPLAPSLMLGLRASYVSHSAVLSEREAVRVIVGGVGRDGAFEHTVDASIATLGFEPSVQVRLAGSLFATFGARTGLFLEQSYLQEERIVDPGDVGTFLDSNGQDSRSRVRNQASGELPGVSRFLAQAVFGVAWELPLNEGRTTLLVPEASYALSISDVVSSRTWKPDGLRLGLALKFQPAPAPPKPIVRDTVVVRDTTLRESSTYVSERVVLESRNENTERLETAEAVRFRTTAREHYVRERPLPPPMRCALSVAGVNDRGEQEAIATLRIEEFLSSVAHPLLNFVFFEPGSSALPARYTLLEPAAASSFRSDDLRSAGTLDVYHTMLNVIGERMRRYPAATLSLMGCNMDHGAEKGDLALSKARAEAVRDYLVRVWGITADRMRTDAVNLPEKRSNPLTPDGQGENRRVEIAATMPEILDVLILADTLRQPSVPVIRVSPSIVSASAVGRWELTISQRDRVLKRFSGEGTPPGNLDWDIANDGANAPRFSEPLVIALTARNVAGQEVACRSELPTQAITISQKRENRVGDYTIDRYNLILFSVGAAVITPANQRIIDLIRSRLKPEAALTIEGYADRSGNPAGNQKLSENRARATASALGRPDAVIRGIGEARLLHSNDTPEGRYYCRTVQIQVKTPVGR